MNMTAEWAYPDGGFVRRYDGPEGKKVIPYFVQGEKAGIPDGYCPPLYGEVDRDLTFVVEGEKCADAVEQLGFSAVASQGGSRRVHKSDWSALEPCQEVILLPDNDEPGENYIGAVAGILKSQNPERQLRVLRLPDLPAKGDVVDWIQDRLEDWDGYTRDVRIAGLQPEFCELLEQAEPFESCDVEQFQSPTYFDGETILDEIHAFMERFIAYPSEHAHVAHTLWIAHTHLMEVWESTPRLAALSPEPECGKSRVLEVSESLVPNPIEACNVSAAYMFRKVSDPEGRATLLYDEIDTVFGPKARENEEIRGLLNAGHRKHAKTGRCSSTNNGIVTEEFPAYCAVAMAGIGNLPDTLLSRSVVLKMRRRAPVEKVEPWRRRIHYAEGEEVRQKLADWAKSVEPGLMEYWPEMPEGVEDRAADLWEPLLAVADEAGGKWPELARVACVALVAESRESTPSLGVRLLNDLKQVFGERESMGTQEILAALNELEESPWGSLGGKPLDARGLATRLREYDVKSRDLRVNGKVLKGYSAESLRDSWQRYLIPPPQESATPATAATNGREDEN